MKGASRGSSKSGGRSSARAVGTGGSKGFSKAGGPKRAAKAKAFGAKGASTRKAPKLPIQKSGVPVVNVVRSSNGAKGIGGVPPNPKITTVTQPGPSTNLRGNPAIRRSIEY